MITVGVRKQVKQREPAPVAKLVLMLLGSIVVDSIEVTVTAAVTVEPEGTTRFVSAETAKF